MADNKNSVPGLVSDNWPGMPKVSRSDLDRNTVRTPVKGGITVRNAYKKDEFRRTPGNPPGGNRGNNSSSEPKK